MAERLPVGAARNSNSPSFGSFSPSLAQEVSTAAIDALDSHMTSHELDSKGSNSLVISNGSSTINNHTLSHSEVVHLEATVRSKTRTGKAEPTHGDEWVEQDEPGVYMTLVSLPGGAKDLKRVRFRYFITKFDLVSLSLRCSMYSKLDRHFPHIWILAQSLIIHTIFFSFLIIIEVYDKAQKGAQF
jgi:hypothetical protein